MTRAAAGETVIVKPANNLYTWLAGVTVALQVIALLLIFMRLRTME